MQFAPMMELVISKAARQLGIDPVAIHRINAPAGKAPVGPPQPNGRRRYITSAFVQEALDKGAELFGWEERKLRSGVRQGSKVRGVGVAVGTYSAGSIGFDGLLTLEPDGKLYIQSGCSHLGNNSVFDTTRAAAEVLDMPWEKVVITYGDTSRNLPWSCGQGGSQTTHAHTRANWAAGLDAKRKLREIAAKDLGGRADDYDVAHERVYRKGNPGRGLTFAQAAQRAIEIGAEYDGHDLPSDINAMTKASATALAGRGLMGVAKDTFQHDGDTMSFVAGFAEVEVDVETGAIPRRRLHGGRRHRHGAAPAELSGPGVRRHDARGGPRDRTQVGVRQALRPVARQPLLPQQAAVDPGCAALSVRGARYARSRDACRGARRRRAAGRCGVRRGRERADCRHRRRGVPADRR